MLKIVSMHPSISTPAYFCSGSQCGRSRSQHALAKKQGISSDSSPLCNTDKRIHSFGQFRDNMQTPHTKDLDWGMNTGHH